MTLTTDLVDFLLTRPEVQALVTDGTIGSDAAKYPRGYIFEGKPYAKIDNLSHSCTVVVSSTRRWSPPLRGGGLEYPLVNIEIWAAPTKNPDGSIEVYDAEDVVEIVYAAIKPYVHIIHRSDYNGAQFQWGKSSIVTSEIIEGLRVRPISNAEGCKVGMFGVGVQK